MIINPLDSRNTDMTCPGNQNASTSTSGGDNSIIREISPKS